MIEPDALLPANSMSANIPISAPKHAVAMASLIESIKDNAATAAAITPIATAIAITFPFTSFAPCVALIILVMIMPRTATAITPFASCSVSTRPSRTDIPARSPIATDTASSVPASFTVSPPLDVILIRADKNAKKTPANLAPFIISSGLN